MKRILHLLSSGKYSGAENVAATVISSLSGSYEMAYASPKVSVQGILEERGIDYIQMKSLSQQEGKRVVGRWNPDIIHTHDFKATIMMCFITNKPIVAHFHQNPSWLKHMNIRSAMVYLSCYRLAHIILVSEAIGKAPVFAWFQEKTTVIENIVDIDWIKKKSREANHGMAYDVVFVGRLIENKDPLRFIRVMSGVRARIPGVKAAIIGDGPLAKLCDDAIAELRLSNNVDMLGYLSNPYPLIANSKVLVMTSKSEGLPMALIEAIALGKPIVVSNIAGVQRYSSADVGRICITDDDFVSAIVAVLSDTYLYNAISERASYYAANKCNLQRYGERFDEIYHRVLFHSEM